MIKARKFGSLDSKVPSLAAKQTQPELKASSSGNMFGRSFMDVLQSEPGGATRSDGFKLLSLQLLDLFPVMRCFETGNEEVESRIVVDCYELERSLQKSALAEADSTMMRKKTKGIFGNR